MRATDRELKQRHAKLPEDKKKIDTSVNGDAERLIEERREIERHLYPLRLDHKTVIYVTKDKQNEAYADKARKRMGITTSPKVYVDPLSIENLTRLYKEDKVPVRKMAEILNVSIRTVYMRLAKYHLTNVPCR